MQIYCPKCKTGYEIEAAVVPENGRKLRCAVCGKIFYCMPEDLIDGSKLRQAEFTEEEKQNLDEKGMLIEPAPAEIQEEKAENKPEAETDSVEIEIEEESPAEENEEEAPDEEPENEEGLPTKSLDELEAEAKEAGSQEVQDIFQRLSQETEALFQEESEAKPVEKILSDVKKGLGLRNPRNYKYYLFFILACLLLTFYYFRYEIVRKMPATENIYSVFGIKSRVVGEGLEFQNISRREFEEDDLIKFEIKGFIANNTDKTIDIPMIYAELLDKDANKIQTEAANSVIPLVAPHSRVAFSFVIDKPSALSKYIYLTFSEKK